MGQTRAGIVGCGLSSEQACRDYFCHHSSRAESVTILKGFVPARSQLASEDGEYPAMEVLTSKAIRRSTRLRVEIPVSVISLDRTRPFAEKCMLVIVSAQGCGFRSSRALSMETPIMLSDLPGGSSVTARVANCLPLGNDGKYFLIGAALYTHGNVWGIVDPPEDWNIAAQNDPAPPATNSSSKQACGERSEGGGPQESLAVQSVFRRR